MMKYITMICILTMLALLLWVFNLFCAASYTISVAQASTTTNIIIIINGPPIHGRTLAKVYMPSGCALCNLCYIADTLSLHCMCKTMVSSYSLDHYRYTQRTLYHQRMYVCCLKNFCHSYAHIVASNVLFYARIHFYAYAGHW